MVSLSRWHVSASALGSCGVLAYMVLAFAASGAIAQEPATGGERPAASQAAPAPTLTPVAPAQAAPVTPVTTGAPATAAAAPAASPTSAQASADAHQYCQAIAGAAADARFAYQASQIKDLEDQLQARVQQLEAKEAEFRDAMGRRDAAMKRAAETLVAVFAKMRPDAAAAELAGLDDDTAAAVLTQLKPRVASAILNEVTPDRAVQLINAIATPAGPAGKKS